MCYVFWSPAYQLMNLVATDACNDRCHAGEIFLEERFWRKE